MKVRFDIYLQHSSNGPVKHFCDALSVHEKGIEVMVESLTALPPLRGKTYFALRPGSEGKKELWSISFVPFQNTAAPNTYIGTYGRLFREVASDWVDDL